MTPDDLLTPEQRRHREDADLAVAEYEAARRKPAAPRPPRKPRPTPWNEPPPTRDAIDGIIDDLPPRATGTTLEELLRSWP